MKGGGAKSAAVNVFEVADRNRILDLLRKGWSIRQVARDTGHRHETIRRYGMGAGILTPKLAKCTTPAEVPTDPKPHTEPGIAHRAKTAHRARTAHRVDALSSAEPFRDFIEAELRKGRNAEAIFRDLVLHRGYDGSYDAVKRLARTLRKREPKISCRLRDRARPRSASGFSAKAHECGIHAREDLASHAFRDDAGQQPARVSQSRLEIVNGDLVPMR